MKKRLCGLAAACLFAAVLSGCGPAEGSAESAPVTESAPPIESGPVMDSAPPALSEELTQEELNELSAFLSQTGNCEFFINEFSSPDEVDITVLLNDGAGITELTRDFSQDEAALRALGEEALDAMLDEQAPGVRLTGAEIRAYVEEKLGVTLSDQELQARVVEQSKTNGWGRWYYVAETDTFYHFENGTSHGEVFAMSGAVWDDDRVSVYCTTGYGHRGACLVSLTPTQEGWRFLAQQGTDSERLGQEELDEFSAFLSQPGVCGLFWSGFAAPEEADLSAMLYDGAGLEQGPLTQEEAEALGPGADLDVTKLTTAQIQELLRERLGLAEVEADWLREKLPDWTYLPDYDAFYLCHGDTLMRSVTCETGMRGRDSDSVKLICRTDAGERYAAVLTENSGGSWRIDSILPAD